METKWRSIGEAVGLSAVVISVALLGWELNQANRLTQAIEEREILQLYNDLNLSMASDPEFGAFNAMLASEDGDELTETEHERALSLVMWQRNVWEAVSKAHSLGIVSETRYQLTLQDIRVTAELWPKLRPYMRMTSETYYQPVEFSELDRIIMEVTAE